MYVYTRAENKNIFDVREAIASDMKYIEEFDEVDVDFNAFSFDGLKEYRQTIAETLYNDEPWDAYSFSFLVMKDEDIFDFLDPLFMPIKPDAESSVPPTEIQLKKAEFIKRCTGINFPQSSVQKVYRNYTYFIDCYMPLAFEVFKGESQGVQEGLLSRYPEAFLLPELKNAKKKEGFGP